MKIQSVTMAAFRSFSGITIPLNASRVIVGGINGAGKTSIRECIRWVLTGRAQGLDGRGVGVEDLAPDTGNGPSVQAGVTIDGLGVAIRGWAPDTGSVLSVSGLTGSTKEQQEALYQKLNTTEAYLEAVLDTDVFLKLDHAAAKALVMALLDVKVSVVLRKDGPAETLTLDELEIAYKLAFEDRKVAKRVLQAHAMPPAPVVREVPPLEAVDARLTEIQTQLDALLTTSGGELVKRAQAEGEVSRLSAVRVATYSHPEFADIDAVNVAIEDLDERLAMMEQDAITEDLSEAMPTLQSAVEPGIGTEGRLTFLRGRAEALRTHQPKLGCVLDPDVPCETAKQRFTARAKLIEKEIDDLPQPAASAQPVEKKRSPITDARLRLGALHVVRSGFQQATDTNAQHARNVEKARATVAALPDSTAITAEIEALKGRIAKGKAIRQEVVDYTRTVETYAKAKAQRDDLVADVDRLEVLVETLGPKGIRVEALGQAIKGFEDAINGYLKAFGFTIWFVLDPTWAVMVNGRRAETYSKSERYRIGIALQLAIAQLSGLDFAVVDELDMLLTGAREVTAKLLHFSPIGQIIVLGAREPDVPLPVIQGVICHRVDIADRKSVVVETTGVTA